MGAETLALFFSVFRIVFSSPSFEARAVDLLFSLSSYALCFLYLFYINGLFMSLRLFSQK